jgi:hypothetical protein
VCGAGIVVMDKRLSWSNREHDRGDGDKSENDPAGAN